MRSLLLLAGCLLCPAFLLADDDPEPPAGPDKAIEKLDHAATNAEKLGKEKAERLRKELVARLGKIHAGYVKNGNADKARELKDRLLLAESLAPGKGLDTKLHTAKLLEKASSDGKYRELLHVLYLPQDKTSYQEFRDFGMWTGTGYYDYNNLKPGYWVYLHPRWYIWKELKPGK